MAFWKKILIGLGLLLLLLIGATAFFISRLPDLCGNTILAEHSSPDGQLKAVVFDRNCGATTDFSTQVSIVPSNVLLDNEGGNVFSADTNHGRAPAWKNGGPEIRLRWISDTRVELQYHWFSRVLRAATDTGRVQVTYLTFQ